MPSFCWPESCRWKPCKRIILKSHCNPSGNLIYLQKDYRKRGYFREIHPRYLQDWKGAVLLPHHGAGAGREAVPREPPRSRRLSGGSVRFPEQNRCRSRHRPGHSGGSLSPSLPRLSCQKGIQSHEKLGGEESKAIKKL